MTTKIALLVLVVSLAFWWRDRRPRVFVFYRDEVVNFRPTAINLESWRECVSMNMALSEAGKQKEK